MPTTLHFRFKEISPELIRDLAEKHGEAEVELRIFPNLAPTDGMNEDRFWQILTLLDWKKADPQAVLEPAVETLSHFSRSEIEAFHSILHEKLFALDGKRFADELGSNRFSDEKNGHFSVDDFLYSRCAVVANGHRFFETVLKNPSKMPKEYTFEALLSLPEMAWAKKTGLDDYDFSPETWAETFSNTDGWPGKKSIKDRILNG